MVATTSRTGPALLGISLAYFMVLLDTTVLAVAEPNLMASLHIDVIGVGWATTTYTMALASALVIGGVLADRLGAGWLFVGGTVGFGVVSLACALSPGLAVLLVSRTVLGFLAAAIIPSSMALLATLYPSPRDRTRAISVWASVSGAAMAAGPVVGGWLIGLSGWRAVFVLNVPIALVALFLCRGRVRVAPYPRRFSVAPHLGLMATLGLITFAITSAGQRHWTAFLGATVAALGSGVATAWLNAGAAAPLIPRALRANRAVWTAFGWGAIVNYALTSILFAIPLVSHEDAATTGITLLPMTILVALNPLATGRLVARFGPLVPIRLGFVAFSVGLCVTAFALARDQPWISLAIGLFCCGLGVSWTLPPLVGYAVSHAPVEAVGAVGGILNATRQIGATLGAAAASATLAASSGGFSAATPLLGAAAFCGLGLVSSLAGRRRP